MLTIDNNHIYRWNDSIVPGTTQILTELGLIDPRFFTDQARERGRIVHSCLALLLKNDLDWTSVDERLLSYVKAGERAIDELKIRPRIVEQMFYHDLWKYAGIPDLLDQDDRLNEWKTGVMLPAYKLQVGFYEILLEHNGHPVKQRRIIQLNDDATYKIHPVDLRIKRDAIAVLSYYNLKNNYGVKNGSSN